MVKHNLVVRDLGKWKFGHFKSDDVIGRTRMYESIVKGEQVLEPGLPESFNVLIRELQALCLDVKLEENNEEESFN